ncbi:MAG: ATP-dependent Clp protease ATP-binding subunit [Bacilli bacterium]|nr:ATP-dependent Clp protease ATP-binding subunit [Bacilli bacterium]
MQNYNFVKDVIKKNELVGRRDELAILKESMFKKRMKNTILIGNAGCGKTAILEQFAYDMSHHYNLVELDIGACVAGTSLRGEFEEKLINFLNEVSEFNKTYQKKIIIFIDEIHTLYEAGGSEGAVDASNIIKSYLSRGEITIIGATTLEEYKKTISKDKALSRRLSPIFIKDLDDKTNLVILKKFAENIVSDELISYIYEESKKLGKTNPDISIEILDRCMARQKFTGNPCNEKSVNSIIKYMKEGMIM